MKRGRRFAVGLLLSTAVLVQPTVAGRGSEPRPPSVVLIVADDLGWGDVSFNGRKEWSTPNLDRTAREGLLLRRCYAAATVCAPSRAALLTGKYPIHNGVRTNRQDLPAGEVTIAEALRDRGYVSGLVGKWHQGARGADGGEPLHPMDQGFDEFFGYLDAVRAWEKFPSQLWNGRELVPVMGYADDLITDGALEFIHRHRNRPFFLYIAYVATHFHVAAPEDEVALHRGRFAEEDQAVPRNATYAAMVTRMDRNIGRLLAGLEHDGLSRETLLIFTSDQGATFEKGNQGTSAALDSNHPFRGQKRTLWEGGIRVPGIVWWPGRIAGGTVCDQPVHLTDLLPTIVAAAGGSVDARWKLDGMNLLPNWTAGTPIPPRTLFWEWRSEGFDQLAALDHDHKLIITRGGKPELYNVVIDPAERRDLSETLATTTETLATRLKSWLSTEISPPLTPPQQR
jgi:arylsulfatase A